MPQTGMGPGYFYKSHCSALSSKNPEVSFKRWKMAALAIMESPVRMTLHSIISSNDLLGKKYFPTTITMQSDLSLPPVSLDFPLQLASYEEEDVLRIRFVSESKYSQVVQQVRLYCQQVSFQPKDTQGKELKEWIFVKYQEFIDLDSCDTVGKVAAYLKKGLTRARNSSEEIDVEVKIIFLEAKFKAINEVVLPPCCHDSLTTKALDKFTNEKIVKITITTEQDQSFKEQEATVHFFAHKDVLMARSPVFAKMFEHDLQESTTSSITVSDIEPEVFKEVISFIYSNQVPNLSTMAGPLLYAAEKYQLDGLKTKCEQFLSYNLQVGNAVQTLQLAQTYSASQLKENASRFIIEFINEVRESNDWGIVKRNCDLMDELLSRVEPAAKRPKAQD